MLDVEREMTMVTTPTPAAPNDGLLLTIEETAKVLRIGQTRTYELVMSGLLRSVKIGRRRLVLRAGVDEYVTALALEQAGGVPTHGP